MIFFTKSIKEYRKNRYIMDRLKLMNSESVSMKEYPDIFQKVWGKEYEECQNHIRYQKLKKLQRKSKPNFLKRIL